MENLDHLKKTSKIKLIIMCLATILPIVLIVVFELIPNHENSAVADLIIIRYGILVLLEGYIGLKIYSYIKILTSIDFAQTEVIKRNDERNKYIKLKTESMTIKICLYLLGIALLVTAFINRFIFYTLIGVLLVGVIVFTIVKIYYSKKY
jgi:hypothetical protein